MGLGMEESGMGAEIPKIVMNSNINSIIIL